MTLSSWLGLRCFVGAVAFGIWRQQIAVTLSGIISVVQEKEVQDNAGVALKVWQIFDILHEEQIFRLLGEQRMLVRERRSWRETACGGSLVHRI